MNDAFISFFSRLLFIFSYVSLSSTYVLMHYSKAWVGGFCAGMGPLGNLAAFLFP